MCTSVYLGRSFPSLGGCKADETITKCQYSIILAWWISRSLLGDWSRQHNRFRRCIISHQWNSNIPTSSNCWKILRYWKWAWPKCIKSSDNNIRGYVLKLTNHVILIQEIGHMWPLMMLIHVAMQNTSVHLQFWVL